MQVGGEIRNFLICGGGEKNGSFGENGLDYLYQDAALVSLDGGCSVLNRSTRGESSAFLPLADKQGTVGRRTNCEMIFL